MDESLILVLQIKNSTELQRILNMTNLIIF